MGRRVLIFIDQLQKPSESRVIPFVPRELLVELDGILKLIRQSLGPFFDVIGDRLIQVDRETIGFDSPVMVQRMLDDPIELSGQFGKYPRDVLVQIHIDLYVSRVDKCGQQRVVKRDGKCERTPEETFQISIS